MAHRIAANAAVSGGVLTGPWLGLAGGAEPVTTLVLHVPFGWIWAAAALAAALVIGAAWGLSRVRRRELRRERQAQDTLAHRLLESQEKERRRIASELHDSLGQNLLIIKNRALLALEGVGNAAEVTEQLEEISRTATQAIEECRQITRNLSTSHLEQLGLTEALNGMLDRLASSTCLRFERRLDTVDDLFTVASATHLYRIAQEALNNVIKHARASVVRVELLRDARRVRLLVQDNGCGFEVNAGAGEKRSGGLGLLEMAERARLLHWTLELESRPGQGTRLALAVPVPETLPW